MHLGEGETESMEELQYGRLAVRRDNEDISKNASIPNADLLG